ncbi:hypothetical protein [Halomonas sp. NO4]|uniref:putative PDDEXK endonuclease n=1 Tax=Halomonas sp. NO4 TaxID=2484813 RepID=UPI0013D02328|nr:hypothetical protein [Halomonas sp. NO4]
MAKASREKGRKAEGEVARLLGERLGLTLKRRLTQTRTAREHDLDGWDGVCIEVKRHKRATQSDIAAWWRETLGQCHDGEAPLLAYRADMQDWRFVIRPSDWGVPIDEPIQLDIEGLAAWREATDG